MRRFLPGPMLVVLLVCGLVCGGCLPSGLDTTDEALVTGKVQVRYLGVGGYLIRRNHDVIMTAPLYSNPTLGSVLNGTILPHDDVIDAFVKPPSAAHHITDADLSDLRAIFSGHAHYDHLMDVPHMLAMAPHAVAVGSTTMRNILLGYSAIDPNRIKALNDRDPAKNYVDFTACRSASQAVASDPSCNVPPSGTGQWWPVPGTTDPIRVYALCSRHPPQVVISNTKIHFGQGCADCARSHPPRYATDYPEGEVFAYVFDFFDAGQTSPVFRIYYEDAPLPPELSGVLANFSGVRKADLALLNDGNWEQVRGAEGVVASGKLDAQQVILGHWENFFDPLGPTQRKLEALPVSPADEYRGIVAHALSGANEAAKKDRVHILAPGVQKNFPRP
jgi:hypothetical protein